MHLWGHAFHLRGCALVSFKFCIVIGILIVFRKILVFSSLFENFSSANKFNLGFSRRAYLLIRHKVAAIDQWKSKFNAHQASREEAAPKFLHLWCNQDNGGDVVIFISCDRGRVGESVNCICRSEGKHGGVWCSRRTGYCVLVREVGGSYFWLRLTVQLHS